MEKLFDIDDKTPKPDCSFQESVVKAYSELADHSLLDVKDEPSRILLEKVAVKIDSELAYKGKMSVALAQLVKTALEQLEKLPSVTDINDTVFNSLEYQAKIFMESLGEKPGDE